VSSSRDELGQASRTLARKAAADATAARRFAGAAEITDEIVGFHTQQAIEKWLKAIIASRGENFEHTHDLRRLLVLVAGELAELPFDPDAVIALTQYSAPLRYEDLLDSEPLDREATIELLAAVGSWAAEQLESGEPS
jgi:HEPN domain-containing protein